MKCYREFEWQIATAKNLTQQHFFRDRQDFDRGSYKMASFDKGQERKKTAQCNSKMQNWTETAAKTTWSVQNE